MTECGSQLLHPTLARKRVAQGLEEPDFGAKLVVDGHAGNIGLACNGINGKAIEAIASREQFARRCEDAGTRLFGGHLALTESVGTRAHR